MQLLIDNLKTKANLYKLKEIYKDLETDLKSLQSLIDDQKKALKNALKNRELVEISQIKKEVYKVKEEYVKSYSFQKMVGAGAWLDIVCGFFKEKFEIS
jgi:hypothetical protein